MKKFLVACLIGLGSITATAAPSLADDVRVMVYDRGYHPDRHYGRDEYRPHRPHHRNFERRHHAYRDNCRTKKVKFRHHGRWVYKTTTVCR
ncbi:hypothetical protein ACQZ61_12265 [Agrobacterium vitis]|uniref:Uncharacterized protein n=1 Tax=Agrobacterium vitis TaxID=373 RepID=A0A1S2DU05_AGRVI|nr:hypothetical protein [Agrobacterium vitis]MCE6077153.1 hypothetical protein [Agrobacterium vitis]MCF1453146.1 hypothetical protein [Agrobacterium vitis]MCF1467845.1 hypothetical protein [Agrobacterium vitis]MCM2469124.1 hypothetical protein [Agrobacterium vitis]MUO69474.1 hypothetical protein [Agrobacterium vitis]